MTLAGALLAWLGAAPEDRFEQALALLNAQRFTEARPLLEAHVADHPQDANALSWLAYAQVSLGDSDATLATTARALELSPSLGPLWYHRGRALLLEHDFAAADSAFTKTKELAPDFFPAWRSHFQALAALGVGDEGRATLLYQESPESSPAASPWSDPAFLFERMATLFPIVPEPEPGRGWYRRAATEYFTDSKVAAPLELPPPVRGEWFVSQANFGDESHFGIAGSFSFDLGLLKNGELYRRPKDGSTAVTRNDFFTYDAEVEAPAAAIVARVVDGLPDNDATLAEHAPLSALAVRREPLGNHVVLQFGDDAFLLLAHLRSGTIKVKTGEAVKRAQPIGRIGQSGVSYAPHLHLTAWSRLDPMIGRPLRFTESTLREPDGGVVRGASVLPAIGAVLIHR